MAFTAESRAKGAATQAANRAARGSSGPATRHATKRKRAKPAPTIILSPPDATASTPPGPPPGAPSSLMDPGASPDQTLHRMLMVLFGPVNYLLHRLGGFDLVQEEADLILIPAERIIVRRGLAAHGQLPPDLFDGIQIATGVLLYGVRLAPQIAERRSRGGGGGGSGPAAGSNGHAARGGNQTAPPGATGNLAGGFGAALTPEDFFDAIDNPAQSYPANGHSADPLRDAGHAGQPGASGG